jgi:hypothetical protein
MAKAPKLVVVKEDVARHPTLCFKQNIPLRPPFTNAFARCIFTKGHDGPHSWEPGAKLADMS